MFSELSLNVGNKNANNWKKKSPKVLAVGINSQAVGINEALVS